MSPGRYPNNSAHSKSEPESKWASLTSMLRESTRRKTITVHPGGFVQLNQFGQFSAVRRYIFEMYAGVNLYGSPDEIAARLRQQKELLGVDHDVLVMPKYGSMTQAEAEASMEIFAREVIPKL